MNVLVTSAGGFQGLTVFKELNAIKNTSVRTFMFDINQENCGKYFFDYSIKCPPISDTDKFNTFLFSFCKKNDIHYIIPATGHELATLANLKNQFLSEIGCTILVPDLNIVEQFLDKKRTAAFLEKHNLASQTQINPHNLASYPIFGKPNKGWGGKGTLILRTYEDFVEAGISDPELYSWSAYHEDFDEFSIDFSINFQGTPSPYIIRKRNFVSGGFAVISETVKPAESLIKIEIEKILSIFSKKEFMGIYNIQIISTKNELFVSDINPRMGTSAVMASAMGQNIVSHVLGFVSPPPNESVTEHKCVRYLQEKYFRKIDLSQIKGVVFDLDDTLISNKNFVLKRCELLYSHFPSSFGNYDHFMIFIISLLNEGKAPTLINEICKFYQLNNINEVLATYRKCFPDVLYTYNDVEVCFKKLKAKGLKIFILTDNPIITQKNKIKRFEYIHYVDSVFYTDSINSIKPMTQCFDMVCAKSGFSHNELVMIGDNYYRDCIGSLDAGFSQAFLLQRPDGIISHFDGIKDYYKKHSRIEKIESLTDLTIYFEQ